MLDISYTTKGNSGLTGLPFATIKDAILGKKYELSLMFVGDTLSRRLNRERRGKTYVPNILSFPLSNELGEMFINPRKAKIECKKFGYTFKEHIVFLFIHGCVHLKGFDHGPEMDKLEKKFRIKFNLKEPLE